MISKDLWHLPEVCKCPVRHVENRPNTTTQQQEHTGNPRSRVQNFTGHRGAGARRELAQSHAA